MQMRGCSTNMRESRVRWNWAIAWRAPLPPPTRPYWVALCMSACEISLRPLYSSPDALPMWPAASVETNAVIDVDFGVGSWVCTAISATEGTTGALTGSVDFCTDVGSTTGSGAVTGALGAGREADRKSVV